MKVFHGAEYFAHGAEFSKSYPTVSQFSHFILVFFITFILSIIMASVSTLEKVFCAMQNNSFETLRDLSQLSKEKLSKWNVLSPDEVSALVSGKVFQTVNRRSS